VCPVKINIHELLLLNRQQSVAEGLADNQEKLTFQLWTKAMKNRRMMDLVPVKLKNMALKMVLKDTWSRKREPLQVAPKSFGKLWKEHQKKK
jgi:L-lactate dehydrogenase complex protein LldF